MVDDHPGFRRIARELLAAEGFEVVGDADHGAAADYGSLVEQSGARGFVSKADLSGAVLAGLLESQPA